MPLFSRNKNDFEKKTASSNLVHNICQTFEHNKKSTTEGYLLDGKATRILFAELKKEGKMHPQ